MRASRVGVRSSSRAWSYRVHTQNHDIDAQTERELWSINDLARRHSVSRRHVYSLIERGELEARKIGRLTVVTEASRRAWVDSLPPMRSASAAATARQVAA